jgi:DNA (cytosine-5)-methyltransferase 1
MKKKWGISLFCGAGGLDHGIESTDRMEVRLGIDLNPDVEPTWRANAKRGSRPDAFRVADVRDLHAEDLPPGADFMLGSTPCQAFSHANSDRDPDDPDIGYGLVRAFLDLVRKYRLTYAATPFYWAMENVPALRPIIRRRDGWIPKTTVLNSADFGTPQIRHRLFAGDYPDPLPTHMRIANQLDLDGRKLGKWVSVREALGLSVLRRSHDGGTSIGEADDRPSFAVGTNSGAGTLMNAASVDYALDPDALAPTMFFGGNRTDGTPQGGGAHPWSLWEGRPSTTVMEGAIATPGHSRSMWMSLRRLTPGECAILQGFPADFKWVDRKPRPDGSPRKTLLYSMIGNAVPPQFGRALGEAMLRGFKVERVDAGSLG